MAREKVRLAAITNEKKRKSTFKRRVNGFMNKVRELSTLCDINVCAIVFSPYDIEPMVRPSPLEAQEVISQYNSLPTVEKYKNMFNQTTFLRQRIDKVDEQLRKKQTQNRERKFTELMFECLSICREERLQNLSLSELNVLGTKIDEKLAEVNERMESLRKTTDLQQVASPLPVAPPLETPMWMAQQQVAPSPTPTLPQPVIPIALQQQVAPPPMDPFVPIVSNDQIQANQFPQQFNNNWVNQPMDDMIYGQVGENQIMMPPLNNNSTMDWTNTSYDPASANLALNPHGFFNSS